VPHTNLRDQLEAAAARLREVDSASLAAPIDTVLAPGGWAALRDSAPTTVNGSLLQLRLSEKLRDEVVAAASEAGMSVGAVVNEGFRAFLAGQFVPDESARPVRGRPPAGQPKNVVLSVQAEASLRQQVKERADMSPPGVAVDYLLQKFHLGPYAPAEPSAE
jgi:hypothetical protein